VLGVLAGKMTEKLISRKDAKATKFEEPEHIFLRLGPMNKDRRLSHAKVAKSAKGK